MKEQTFWQNTKRFFEPIKENKLYSFTVFIEYFLWSSLWIVAIFFIKDITQILETGIFGDLKYVLVKYLGIFSLLMIASYLIKDYGWVRFTEALRNTLFRKYLPKFIQLDNTLVEKEGTGKINHLLQQGVNAHTTMLNDTFYNIAKILPFFIFTLYFIFQIYAFLGVVFIFLYIGLLFFVKYFDAKQVRIRFRRHMMKKEISRHVAKIIMSKYEILQNANIDHELDTISGIFQKITINNKEQNFWGTILFRGTETILFISKIVLVFFIGGQYFSQEITLTYAITFITVILYFEKNAQDFLIFYKNFTRDMHEMTGLWGFFDSTPQIQGYDEGNIFQYKKGNIELKNISYSYDENKKVFENFSAKIVGGNVTALVGPSGGGKSTLAKLIAGYIRVDSGEIIIDYQKLSETSMKSYYSSVGFLTQEPSVFDGTIRENLLYALGEEQGDETALQDIIELAHCDFISDLPNGLDTEIGERGIKLSGGQKQRLAIAKLFLKNPNIVILDEPTSALDSVSEKKITQALHNLFEGRSVIVIAHRLQTVKYADEIIVIDQGSIIERGNHRELTDKNGYYAEMLELQSGF